MGRSGIFDCVSAYPRIHFTTYYLEVYLGKGGTFDCVSAYPRIHFTIYLEVYLGRSGIFDCVSAYPRIHFTTYYLELYLGRGGTFDCVSAYPLHNILRSLLGEEWYFRRRIRVSAYPLHNILLRSLLGEGWYFRLRIRVSSLFRGAASKWQGILQLLPSVPFTQTSQIFKMSFLNCKVFPASEKTKLSSAQLTFIRNST